MRLVFCGTPQFAAPTFEALTAAGHEIELVLTQPDRPRGRGLEVQFSAIKKMALERGLPIMQPETVRNNAELRLRLTELAPHAIIVVAYGRIIPQWMLDVPPHGNINLHASLLPAYRGAAPIQWAIARGEPETGVTTMRLDAGLDTGEILIQRKMAIAPEQTAVELFPVLADLGAQLMVETLAGLDGLTLRGKPQPAEGATLAPTLTREDGHIDWSRAAGETYNRWRGFQPWPGAFSTFRGKKIALQRMRMDDGPRETAMPGTILREHGRLMVACGAATWIEALELQPEGKRQMTAREFLNGHSPAAGERLG